MGIKKLPYYDGDWYIKDISTITNTYGFLTLNTYSDILEEEVEIASVIADDIDVEKIIETFNVISKANNMFKLLEECYGIIEDREIKNRIRELLEKKIKITL